MAKYELKTASEDSPEHITGVYGGIKLVKYEWRNNQQSLSVLKEKNISEYEIIYDKIHFMMPIKTWYINLESLEDFHNLINEAKFSVIFDGKSITIFDDHL